jgi:hypothetical protein
MKSASRKPWAKKYHSIKSLNVYSGTTGEETVAKFEGPLLGAFADDQIRMNEQAFPSNKRYWKINSEADAKQWFLSEISAIVLAAFAKHPAILESYEAKPLTHQRVAETVDILYSIQVGSTRVPV